MKSLNATNDMQKLWDEMINKSRILCVTEDYDNDIMWAHYADNHKGVVLELECLDYCDSPLLLAKPVEYSNSWKYLSSMDDWISIIIGENIFNYGLFFSPLETVKKREWKYEKEWRVISSDLNSSELYEDTKFNKLTFSKIFFGANITEEDKMDFYNIIKVGMQHIKVLSGKFDQTKRRIIFE